MYSSNRFGTTRPRAVPILTEKPHIWFCGGIWRCVAHEDEISCNGRTPQAAYRAWTLNRWSKL